ncbi:hypothetical protein P152DRAFT_456787 [Eremomyces bilateralis CBS 781.70]|uniref:Uncharacterized protein n=1 Tax=Eremomyces bilateralis CBS 781.70 TaxID=1392243 RepID=A0A6G1G8U5_9PEZI|nr:uncharacterized protein P152DRAFT_456787 [Eremomyces bilateralis CBS 781.70]KAF1814525.1 hypothetical protein P152DRAFT_456787 [Eremomyces bilateralis CBS 781.70]
MLPNDPRRIGLRGGASTSTPAHSPQESDEEKSVNRKDAKPQKDAIRSPRGNRNASENRGGAVPGADGGVSDPLGLKSRLEYGTSTLRPKSRQQH